MKICPYCKNENEDANKFCNFCGAPLEDAQQKAEEPAVVQESSYEQTETSEEVPAENNNAPAYDHYELPPANYSKQEQVTPIPIGGYVAWSILVILFCTIPGVIALTYVLRINKATTVEEQQKNLSNAKNALIIGTALAALNLIRAIVQNT